MKRLFLLGAAFAVALSLSFSASAQDMSGTDILSAHIDATGGADAWNAVEDMYAEIEITAATPMGDLVLEMKTWSIFPGYGFTEMGLKSGPDGIPAEAVAMKMYYSPLEGWMEQGGQRQDLDSMPEAARAQFLRTSPKSELALLSDDSAELTLKEEREVDGRTIYVLGAKQFGVDVEMHVDKESLMIVGQSAMGQTTTISDYMEVEGLMFATSQVVETPQGTQTISIKKIELNTGVTPGELETKSGSRKAVMPE